MPERPRWTVGVVVVAMLVLTGCRADPYEGWPDPATLEPVCEQFEATDETIFQAVRAEPGASWAEARAAAAALEAAVSATELPPPDMLSELPFPDLVTAATTLRRRVEEAAQLTDPFEQLDAVHGPVEPIDPLAGPRIDAKRNPNLAFVVACGDRDVLDHRQPLEPFHVAGLVALAAALLAWFGTRRRREPAARTAHTVLGGVLLGTLAGLFVAWGIGAALLARDVGLLGPELVIALAVEGALDPELYLFAFVVGGIPGALVGTFVAWRRSRREEHDRGA